MNILDIDKEIGRLNERKQFLLAVAAGLEKKPASLNEEIFQRYVELESTPKVAEYLRSKGIRTKKNTSFKPGDVSDIVQHEYEDADPALVKMAGEIFSRNTKAVLRQYG
jgi:hypothetical protein